MVKPTQSGAVIARRNCGAQVPITLYTRLPAEQPLLCCDVSNLHTLTANTATGCEPLEGSF